MQRNVLALWSPWFIQKYFGIVGVKSHIERLIFIIMKSLTMKSLWQINGVTLDNVFNYACCYVYSVGQFAHILSQKLGLNENAIRQTLWGDFYLEIKTKRIKRGANVRTIDLNDNFSSSFK